MMEDRIMRTDVRVIAGALVLLFVAAIACLALGYMLLAIVPFSLMCGICWHIEKNKEYYNRQIDRICGYDDKLC